MNRKLLVFIVVSGLALVVAVTVTSPIVRSQADNRIAQRTQTTQQTQTTRQTKNSCMMGDGMMGDGMMRDGMMGDNGGDMQVVHQLFANHDQIRRSVENIPGGVQTLTESDNPEIAALIQQHVASMHQRLEDGRWFAMMSRTLPILFRNADRYQRQSQAVPKGVTVTKTSDDADLEKVLREHAQEVSQFVQNGMPCMDGGMMR